MNTYMLLFTTTKRNEEPVFGSTSDQEFGKRYYGSLSECREEMQRRAAKAREKRETPHHAYLKIG